MVARRLLALAPLLVLAACATQRPAPGLAPPAPAPIVAPPPPALDWRDLPLTPGGWHYAADADGSAARFADGGFVLRCVKAGRQMAVIRTGAAAATALVLKTSYGARRLAAAAGIATIAATDPLFDQIAFSRGRFTVEAAGVPMLVMPAWAEPARVIEDCRR